MSDIRHGASSAPPAFDQAQWGTWVDEVLFEGAETVGEPSMSELLRSQEAERERLDIVVTSREATFIHRSQKMWRRASRRRRACRTPVRVRRGNERRPRARRRTAASSRTSSSDPGPAEPEPAPPRRPTYYFGFGENHPGRTPEGPR